MQAALTYSPTALAEIAGCFAMGLWAGRDVRVLAPAPRANLARFGGPLAQVETVAAGRAFATYGGVYIAASMLWMWIAEGQRPDKWDLAGTAVCLAGAAVILAAPRGE